MQTLNHENIKARKQHVCEFCNSKIEIGKVYHCSTHVYEGTIYKWRVHNKCQEIASTLKMYDYCDEGLGGESFQEFIKEAFSDLRLDSEEQTSFTEELNVVINHHLNK